MLLICRSGDGAEGGTCLGELTLPSSWWPAFVTSGKKAKHPKVNVVATYRVYETSELSCTQQKGQFQQIISAFLILNFCLTLSIV